MTEQKVNKFLRRSFVVMFIVCGAIFIWLVAYMSAKTEQSTSEITGIYMAEVNTQIQQKFTSIINLRVGQVEGIIKRVPTENFIYNEENLQKLEENALIRNFTYLGFYTKKGGLKTICGEEVRLKDEEEIKNELDINKQEKIIVQGENGKGEKILLLGKKAAYPLENGETSDVLLAGVSMEYLNEALFLYTEDALVYSHVIDENGDLIIRNADVYGNNYFERIRAEFEEYHGKNSAEYISELKAAIAKRENYNVGISVNGEEQQLYSSPISGNVRWYLVSIMPNGIMNEALTKLERLRIIVTVSSLITILAVLLYIFVRYYKMSHRQIEEINAAKQEAVKANMAKSEFLSRMSHDIRTPMNAVMGMTEIALKNVENTDKVKECLKKVKLSSKHLLGLINDILDMSKIENGKMTMNISQISLREIVDDIVNIMRSQIQSKNQKFDIFVQNIETEKVYCDNVRLNQVLLNILSNAVKFTPEEGRIDVYIYQEASPEGEEYIRTHFRIKDTGIGMSEEFQKKLWDAFAREETEEVQNITGTGLGMAITEPIRKWKRIPYHA